MLNRFNAIKFYLMNLRHNISYKFNTQSQVGLAGDKFVTLIKLEDFVDLHTGEFLDEK